MDEKCTACSGFGWYYSSPWPHYRRVKCDVCQGTGTKPEVMKAAQDRAYAQMKELWND